MWLDLRDLATVEISSEDVDHPIESALIPDGGPGWQAAQSGKQAIRLAFNINRILLRFEEQEHGRTQEFVLRWLSQSQPPREIFVSSILSVHPKLTKRLRTTALSSAE